MRLVELQSETSRLPVVVRGLGAILGKIQRVGGVKRIYQVGDDHLAVIYTVGNATKAFALAWGRSTGGMSVDRVYVWNKFDVTREPDAELVVPVSGDMSTLIPQIAEWIKSPTIGGKPATEVEEDVEIDEMASRTTGQQFMQMAQAKFGDKAASLTMPEMMQLAQDNDVQIPGEIRMGQQYKVDTHHWNLLGRTLSATNDQMAKGLGAPVENPDDAAEVDPAYQDALRLAKAKTMNRMVGAGKVYVFGRKPSGAFFRIPGVEEWAAQLERAAAKELEAGNPGGRQGMEEQYEMLHDKVKLVAGGGSNFIKSLLITGAPSSGKTFTVMKTIKELGLKEGTDYIVKKGRITTVALYRTLIEQIDGMVVFDDCDSVVEDKNAVNMLKGALDTDPIREISYDVRGTMNTGVMDPAHRDEVVSRMSRILRGKPIEGDLEYFERFVINSKNENDFDDIELLPDENGQDDDEEEIEGGTEKYRFSYNLLHATQQYLTSHLPNKIDFRGRIIFISNMPEDEWDSAILTRAFSVNMDFNDSEMLDYIDKIKAHIKTPGLSEEQKQEVMDYLREIWVSGKLRKQVNFRLVQQCFDLRLTDNWKKLMAML